MHLYQLAGPGLAEQFPPLRQDAAPPEAEPVPFYRRRRVLAITAAMLLAAAAAAVFLATRSGGPGGLAGVSANNVAVIDPDTNTIVDEVPTGRRPGPIAAGRGAIWVGEMDDQILRRIDPKTRLQDGQSVPLEGTPTGVAVDPRSGEVWVANGLLGSVSQVDAQYNELVKTINVTSRSSSGAVDVGGGAVWAVFGNSTLARLPSRGKITTGYAGGEPTGIVYAKGAVWVTNGGDSSYSRFDPETFETGAVETRRVGSHPSAIAYGEGSIWIATAGDGTVWRIDPSSFAIEDQIPVGERPSAITVGAGAVWVANSGDGTVSRIDPSTNTVVKTIPTGNAPAGLVVADGFVWVTVQSP